ncbi:MAG TPA: DUF2127 domain-containing protein [Galbitalea sp.]|jgi:uncharacterized membrane protein
MSDMGSDPPTVPSGRTTLLDRFYFVAVAVKGIDGAVELVVGTLLLVFPTLPHVALESISAHALTWQTPIGQFVANYTEGLDDQLAAGGSAFLVVFLIAHGVIKLALVYCLLRRWYRAYPVALVVLALFFVYQLYLCVVQPTVAIILFAVLDAVIIVLVQREYKELRARAVKPAVER